MDAIAYENDHRNYVIEDVRYSEDGIAQDNDEIAIFVDPITGTARFDYDPKASGNQQYEQFWDNASGWVSGRFGVILGESMSAQGVRYFSIALDRSGEGGAPRNIHVYVSRANASESPAPDDTAFTGGGR